MVIPIIIPIRTGGGYGSIPPPKTHNKWRGGACEWCYKSDEKMHGRLDCYMFSHGTAWFIAKHMALTIGLLVSAGLLFIPGTSPFYPGGTYKECHIPAPDSNQKFDCKNIWQDEYAPHANNTTIEHPDGSVTWYVSHAD